MFNRRNVLKGAVAAAGATMVGAPASAADFKLKWATELPGGHPVCDNLVKAFDRIKKESNGVVEIQFFPDGQLGNNNDLTSQVRAGAIQFYVSAGTGIGNIVPEASVMNVPFAFKNYDEAYKTVDGELGRAIREAIKTRVGLFTFETHWNNGFRQISSGNKKGTSRRLEKPSDLEGFKIRVPASPVINSLFVALGAACSTLSINDLYTALQTGLVEGQENPLVQFQRLRLVEVQKNIALSSHVWDGFCHLGNMAQWQKLPTDVRTLIAKCVDEQGLVHRTESANADEALRKELEGMGVEINVLDTGPFKKKLADVGFYAGLKKNYGNAFNILEKSVGTLG